MITINLFNDPIYDGCYDADKERWDLYIDEKNINAIATDAKLSQDGDTFWNCYLVNVFWIPSQQKYHLIYKEY